MMEIVVTGSSGKLGTAIMKLLRQQAVSCRGVDLLPAETTDVLINIKNRDSVKAAIRNASAIIHTAALHGKHLDLNYSREEFVQTNILGTLYLLEEAVKAGVEKFVYTSTTSIYGDALVNEKAAVWVDEELTPIPRDIYDITKQAAENLCRDFFEKEKLPTCVLRVARFVPEPANSIANYRLYRGLDEADGALAHWLAVQKSLEQFEIFNISNKSPFAQADLKELKENPKEVILRYYPEAEAIYQIRNWHFPDSIDRVYAINKAERILGYSPKNNFIYLLKNNVL